MRGPLPATPLNPKYAEYERELEIIEQETTSGEYEFSRAHSNGADSMNPPKLEEAKGSASTPNLDSDEDYMGMFKKSNFEF